MSAQLLSRKKTQALYDAADLFSEYTPSLTVPAENFQIVVQAYRHSVKQVQLLKEQVKNLENNLVARGSGKL